MIDWHQRYLQQSYWTKSLREYLISTIGITPDAKALEIGCGSGVISVDFQLSTHCFVAGLDIKYPTFESSTRNCSKLIFLNADANFSPFASDSLDFVFCHYFLLWVKNPNVVLGEVKRVLKPGGRFLIFAEPDHSGRIDAPDYLKDLGKLQTEALRQQGVCITMGRELPSLLSRAGFDLIRYGIMGNEHLSSGLPSWWESEWQVLSNDLRNIISEEQLEQWKIDDQISWENHTRVLWVPTFFAIASKPTS